MPGFDFSSISDCPSKRWDACIVHPTHDVQCLEKQIREQANVIALQAQSIAEGTFTGPLHGVVSLLKNNVSTLQSWCPDDRV